MTAYTTYSKKKTPQAERANVREVENSQGGYVYPVDKWTRLDRFLILGSEGGSYYASAKELTRQNAISVQECLHEDATKTIARIVEISVKGNAVSNDPALFALALAASDDYSEQARSLALSALSQVARTGTHLSHFVKFVQNQRGWGRGLRKSIARWYNGKPIGRLAFLMMKYNSRDGWSMRDILRKSHVRTPEKDRNTLYRWATHRLEPFSVRRNGGRKYTAVKLEDLPEQLQGFEALQKTTNDKDAARIIRNHRLPLETVPKQLLNSMKVWDALLHDLPYEATLRNLGNMSKVGLLVGMSDAAKTVNARLTNGTAISESSIHPLKILIGMRTYGQGHGMKGKGTWTPVQSTVDALNDAFYRSFQFIEPTGKRILLAVDISGSMDLSKIAGTPITPRVAAAALSMVTARSEVDYEVVVFSSKGWTSSRAGYGRYPRWFAPGLKPAAISPKQRLDDVLKKIDKEGAGGTDCALPMLYAMEREMEVDAFVLYTDSETCHGDIHPDQALREYRNKSGIPAKMVVVGMVANEFSIADPNDAGSLDVVGFSKDSPSVISDFIRE